MSMSSPVESIVDDQTGQPAQRITNYISTVTGRSVVETFGDQMIKLRPSFVSHP